MYLAPAPIKDLEEWFLATLRPEFPASVYIILSSDESENLEPVPYDVIKVIYTGTNIRETEQHFNFKLIYSCHTPSTLLPHRRSLALLEKGRLALWEKTPPRPANSMPLLLKSEKVVTSKVCGCGPTYVQEWSAYNAFSKMLVPNADPCWGANEPNATLPLPTDYITVFIPDPKYYLVINPGHNIDAPISNGSNPPYFWDGTGWTINPGYCPHSPTIWGNMPFILGSFIKSLTIITTDGTSVLNEQL